MISFSKNIFKAFRIGETLLLTGFFIIGGVFANDKITQESFIYFLNIAIVAFCINNALYAYNAYTGKTKDVINARLIHLQELSKTRYLQYAVLLFIVALAVAWRVKRELFFAAVILGILGTVYSQPFIKFKTYPFSGTFIHFVYQIVAFHAAFAVFKPISSASFLTSVYFALLFSAGHLHHQVIDYEADNPDTSVGTKKTGAISRGIIKTGYFSLILFTISAIYWVVIYFIGATKMYELWLFLGAYLLHLLFFVKYAAEMPLHLEKRLTYRSYYRICYFLAGIGLIAWRL